MKKVILIFILSIISLNLFSQQNRNIERQNFDKRNYFTFGVTTFVDAIIEPIENNDSADVKILFKILYDALSFTQVNPLENPEPFRAIVDVEIVVHDEQGIIRGRLPWTDTLFVKTFEITNSKELYLEGFVERRLSPAKYKVSVDLIDKNLQKDDIKEIDLDIPRKEYFIVKPIFGKLSLNEKTKSFAPFVWDGKVNFSSNDVDVICFAENLNKNDRYYFTLKKIESNSLDYSNDSVDFTSNVIVLDNSTIEFNKSTEVWDLIPTSNSNISLLYFELPSSKLTPGSYSLTISSSKKEELSSKFEVEWIDMPYSLQDFDYSYRVMYYIMTDEEFDNLTSGNDKAIKKKMSDFWQKRDPTIGTPFNEAIEQYYKRVDYSFFNFQSIHERDGAKTAKGKIYILYGPPSDIVNQFVDGKSHEVWIYKKLNKKFTFEIRDKGIFELVSIEG